MFSVVSILIFCTSERAGRVWGSGIVILTKPHDETHQRSRYMWIQFEVILCEFQEYKSSLTGSVCCRLALPFFFFCFVFIELTHPVLGFVEYFINDE